MKPRSWGFLKLFAINGLVAFLLLNLIYWSLPFARLLLVQSPSDTGVQNPSPRLPNYANIDWAEQHYHELDRAQLKADTTDFKSYIGWRRKPFHGKTINVEGKYAQRRTVNSGTGGAKKAYFFGGSTMWGAGANDEGTIPSQFAALTGMYSENFGEAGYTAHQSLMLLIEILQEGHRPDLVVFYDGINEVAIKCVTELTPTSHMLESRIRQLAETACRVPSVL